MTGIIIEQDGIESNYVFDFINFNRSPQDTILFFFNIYKNEIRTQQTYSLILTEQQAIEFYQNWTTHNQIYELLCNELKVDYLVQDTSEIEFEEKNKFEIVLDIKKVDNLELQKKMNEIYEELKIRNLPINIKVEDIISTMEDKELLEMTEIINNKIKEIKK
jgi:hypothetical protein